MVAPARIRAIFSRRASSSSVSTVVIETWFASPLRTIQWAWPRAATWGPRVRTRTGEAVQALADGLGHGTVDALIDLVEDPHRLAVAPVGPPTPSPSAAWTCCRRRVLAGRRCCRHHRVETRH